MSRPPGLRSGNQELFLSSSRRISVVAIAGRHQAFECRTPDEGYIGLRNTGLAAAP
jgi:hypothetical protein